MRQGVRVRHAARGQMLAQISPRLLFRSVFPRDFGNVQQYRLAPFLNGKAAEPRGIDAR